jgi:hypothetical protein
MREVSEMLYLLDRPFILDSSRTEQTLHLDATPLDAALTDLVSGITTAAYVGR